MSKENKAIEKFRNGFNCAQSVLSAYTSDFNLEESTALGITCGFGGGMGKLQETCGAVTGSFMVLGLYNYRKHANNEDRKENTYTMVQEFDKRFKAIHGTIRCHDLINCDLRTEQGSQYARDNNLFEVVCEKCISDSLLILGQLIKD